MAPAGKDPLLEGIGIRPCHEHIHIVVGFQQQDIAAPQQMEHTFIHMADIRTYGALFPFMHQRIAYGVDGIVRRGKGMDTNLAQIKVLVAFKDAGILGRKPGAQPPQGTPGISIGIYGDPILFREHRQAFNMIRMLMGDQYGSELPRIPAGLCQQAAKPPAGNPGVHQNTLIPRLYIHRIPGGAAAKGYEFHETVSSLGKERHISPAFPKILYFDHTCSISANTCDTSSRFRWPTARISAFIRLSGAASEST